MGKDIRVKTKELVAARGTYLGLEETSLDEPSLRRSFCEKVEKFPLRDIVVTLNVVASQLDVMVLDCTSVAGDIIASLESPYALPLTVAEVRQELAARLGVPRQWVKMLLPCGQLL